MYVHEPLELVSPLKSMYYDWFRFYVSAGAGPEKSATHTHTRRKRIIVRSKNYYINEVCKYLGETIKFNDDLSTDFWPAI